MNLLIIEDDKETLGFLHDSLRKEGFVIDTAEDGVKGLYKAKANTYDLIILDLGLPYKDGREICEEIRGLGKETPILTLSVQDDVNTKVGLLGIGADDYVTKPFSYSEILARIRALLRRPHAIRGDVMCVDDLTLDVRKRTVVREGKNIHLTPKEFFLLEYLMRHRGSVLSRTAILEHVWDINADPFTNTIETHILNLRRKIGGKHKRELIHSVSGTGYKLD